MPMTTTDLKKLKSGADAFGLSLDKKQLEKFDNFAIALLDGNKRVNLVGTSDGATLLSHHFLDSLSCLAAGLPADGTEMLDVGSGAGLPGLPLAIALPGVVTTLLDSSAKRTAFLRKMAADLGLDNVRVVCARAEDAGRQPEYREMFDFAVARAVAPLPTLVEYALPFIKTGGRFIAQRGPLADQETAEAAKAIDELSGRLAEVIKVKVPFLDAARRLVVIEKSGPTPDRYPRRCGVPLKRPI
jgi:16S rRNA (guanine527-N7)-methyltransferase